MIRSDIPSSIKAMLLLVFIICLPYRLETLGFARPLANQSIIGANVLVFLAMLLGSSSWWGAFILDSWSPLEILGSAFLHAGFGHVFFNMVYLWVFGNAVCGAIGNMRYLIFYFAAATAAAVLHLIFDGRPAVGASGAIYGVIGLYFAMYPTNRIHCCYFLIAKLGTYSIRGFWLISAWVLADFFGVFANTESTTAFVAHLGGFACGLAIGLVGLSQGWIRMSEYDNPSLIDILKRA